MTSLTTQELRFLNFLSQNINPDVLLGTNWRRFTVGSQF